MSAHNLSFVFFIGSIIFYGIIAQKQAREIESPYDFYNRGNLVRNLFSWTAANITLGTGLFYILASGYTMGLLFICAPIALLLGYFALSQFCSKILPDTIWKHGNLYKGFGSIIDQFSESNTYFAFILSIISVFVFTLILSFEIFVSSKFISICLFSESGQIQQLLISIGVFIAALLYSIWGGFPAVTETDRWQMVFIGIFSVLLFYVLLVVSNQVIQPAQSYQGKIFIFSSKSILLSVAAVVSAFCTQFYSLLNWNAAQQTPDRKKLFLGVGLLTCFILLVFTILTFYAAKNGSPIETFIKTLGILASSRRIDHSIIVAFICLGMTSVVLSTADSLSITISRFVYDNIMSKSSQQKHSDATEIALIRKTTVFLLSISFVLFLFFWFVQPKIIYLLLTIVSGMNPLVPMLILIAFLIKRQRVWVLVLPIFRSIRTVHLYFIISIITSVSSLLSLVVRQSQIPWLPIASFGLSSILSIVLYAISNRSRRSS